jgi:hypothetical protein
VKFTTFITDKGQRIAPVAEVDRIDERQRHPLNVHLREHRKCGGGKLAGELHRRMQTAGPRVVARADEHDSDRPEQNAARLLPGGHEEQRRGQHRDEDRQPAQPGHRLVMQVALTRTVDHARAHREPRYRRRDGEGDHGGDEKRPQGIELVHPAGA